MASDTAASIPYERADCTPEEAVEAVKAVRATAACLKWPIPTRAVELWAWMLRRGESAESVLRKIRVCAVDEFRWRPGMALRGSDLPIPPRW